MKTTTLACCLVILLIAGCKKANNPEAEESKNSCGKTLAEIVPQAYLEEAKKMGFPIHLGGNPPDISGTYRFAPWRHDTDEDYINQSGFAATFSNQTATSIDVSYEGYYEGFENCKPWIMGSHNNFTVCRYVRMDACGANFRFNYMQLISGTKDGNVLRNIKIATIGLDALSPDATCDVAGVIEIQSDADGASQPE